LLVKPIRYYSKAFSTCTHFKPIAEILLSLKNFENKKVDKFFSELVNLSWRCHPDLNWGVELLQSSALPLGYGTIWSETLQKNGASDEARTRYLHLGKVALYQMSYTRIYGSPAKKI
jgi:hypothetical protein